MQMYSQKILLTSSNRTGYMKYLQEGPGIIKAYIKYIETAGGAEISLISQIGQGGWKQNLYYQGWERFIFKFFCFTHPSYPQQGTLHVANGHPHHPIQDGHTNKADLQTQHAPKKETLMSICSPPRTKPPAQEQVSRQTELAQVPSCGWCCLLDGSGCKKNLSNTALWARHRDSVLNTDSSGIQAGVPEHCWNGSMPTVFYREIWSCFVNIKYTAQSLSSKTEVSNFLNLQNLIPCLQI